MPGTPNSPSPTGLLKAKLRRSELFIEISIIIFLAPEERPEVNRTLVIKNSNSFPEFKGWAAGYGSFTCSFMDMNRLIEYIKNQQEHLKKVSIEEEYRTLLLEYGITPDEKFFP
jgi:hypothetical protein